MSSLAQPNSSVRPTKILESGILQRGQEFSVQSSFAMILAGRGGRRLGLKKSLQIGVFLLGKIRLMKSPIPAALVCT